MYALGIDVGSQSLKAVLVQSGWFSVKVVDMVEVALDQRTPASALTDVLVRLDRTPESICVGLDRSAALWRTVELPFSDPGKVAKAAPFAAEEVLPMGLDRVRISHLAARPARGGKFSVPIVAVPISQVDARGSLTPPGGPAPRLQLDCVGVVEALLASHQAPTGDEAVLLVDVGSRTTSLEVVDSQGLWTSRVLRIGTSRMAAAASPHLGGSSKDLEQAFIEAFTGEAEGPAEAKRAVLAIFDDIAREAAQTIAAARSEGIQVSRVVVSGGGARIGNLPSYLGVKLRLPPAALDVAALGGDTGRFAASYGLALTACERGRIPLDFSEKGARSGWDDPFAAGLLGLGLLLAGTVLGGKMWWRALDLEERAAAASAQAATSLAGIGQPGEGPLAPRIERMRKLLDAFRSSSRAPLAVLDAATSSIPIQGNLRFDKIVLDGLDLTIEAQANTFVPAEDLEEEMRSHPGFVEVKLEDQAGRYRGTSTSGASHFVIRAKVKEGYFR